MRDGIKDTKGKSRVDLVPYAAIQSIARVREFGNNKYGSPSAWYNSSAHDDFAAAAIRHLYKYFDSHYYENRSELDEESGLHHLDHALTSLAMAAALREKEK